MTKMLLVRIMEETEKQKKITRIIQNASSVNNESLMRLIQKGFHFLVYKTFIFHINCIFSNILRILLEEKMLSEFK